MHPAALGEVGPSHGAHVLHDRCAIDLQIELLSDPHGEVGSLARALRVFEAELTALLEQKLTERQARIAPRAMDLDQTLDRLMGEQLRVELLAGRGLPPQL